MRQINAYRYGTFAAIAVAAYLLLVSVGIVRGAQAGSGSGQLLWIVTSPFNEMIDLLPIGWVDLANQMQSTWPLMAPGILAGILEAWLLWLILRGDARRADDVASISTPHSDIRRLRTSFYLSGALMVLWRFLSGAADLAPASTQALVAVTRTFPFLAAATLLYMSMMFYRVTRDEVHPAYRISSLVLGTLTAVTFIGAGAYELGTLRPLDPSITVLGHLSPILHLWLLLMVVVQMRSGRWSLTTISLGLVAALLGLIVALGSYYLTPEKGFSLYVKWGYLYEFIYFAWMIQSGRNVARDRRYSSPVGAVKTS